MDTIKLIALADLQLGVVIFALGLLLALRKVPMNDSFGIRIRAAYESEQRWYEVNAYGGRQLAIWSWLIIIAGIAGFLVTPAWSKFYIGADLLATLLTIGLPGLLIWRWSRRR
ncbi:MAG TPA: SdpI family protein [Verrucomicrobiae bacterium]|jgi:uncharacterized membrane protein